MVGGQRCLPPLEDGGTRHPCRTAGRRGNLAERDERKGRRCRVAERLPQLGGCPRVHRALRPRYRSLAARVGHPLKLSAQSAEADRICDHEQDSGQRSTRRGRSPPVASRWGSSCSARTAVAAATPGSATASNEGSKRKRASALTPPDCCQPRKPPMHAWLTYMKIIYGPSLSRGSPGCSCAIRPPAQNQTAWCKATPLRSYHRLGTPTRPRVTMSSAMRL